MQLRNGFEEGMILLDFEAVDIRMAIERVVDELIEGGRLSGALREQATRSLMARELEGSTAIGQGTAVPHGFVDELDKPVMAFVRLAKPVEMAAPDGVRVRYLFVLLGPRSQASAHLETLLKIARLMGDETFRGELRRAVRPKEIREAHARYFRQTEPRPEREPQADPEHAPPPQRLVGGIAADLRARLPHYGADLRDGLHPKGVAATLFMYFACLAPAVAFGGLMAVMTENRIGVVEMLLATGICGVVYALLSAAPLTVLAGTGPLLIFTGMLYGLSQRLGVPFLTAYAWTGLWTGGLLVVLAALNACRFARYLTRFTNEIFAALIALIFIVEAVKDIAGTFHDAEFGPGGHDTALLSLLLAVGTYWVATTLARFRRTPYLRHGYREFFSDFGPAIALGSMTVIGLMLSEDVFLKSLPVPADFGTTIERPWLIDLGEGPSWLPFGAAVPALLATVLIFMNQNITTRLIDQPEHHLSRRVGYHWNLGLVGLLIAACSCFGLPWLMASVIPSLNLLRSLATTEEVAGPGGQPRDRIVHVRENRVTPLAVHLLLGLSLLAVGVLGNMPMAVLFGLFLYMGVSSLTSNQFCERLRLWLMDPARYPPTHYIRKVPVGAIHRYTRVQLACLALLWGVQASPIGIVFPLLIAMLVPLRLVWLGRFIPPKYFKVLDAADQEPDESDDAASPIIDDAVALGSEIKAPTRPTGRAGERPQIITTADGRD